MDILVEREIWFNSNLLKALYFLKVRFNLTLECPNFNDFNENFALILNKLNNISVLSENTYSNSNSDKL